MKEVWRIVRVIVELLPVALQTISYILATDPSFTASHSKAMEEIVAITSLGVLALSGTKDNADHEAKQCGIDFK